MKQKLSLVSKGLLCLICTAAALYAGRLVAFYLMTELFQAKNISLATYTAAPELLKYVWDNTQLIADITALVSAFGVLLFLVTLFPQPKTPFMGTHLFLGIMGILIGYVLVRLLLSFDCVRDGLNGKSGAADYALDILICVCTALLLRACVCEACLRAFGTVVACALSAVLQAGLFTVASGDISPVMIINGVLLGYAFEYMYKGNKTPFPEIMICAGFRTGSRHLAGFSGIKIYPVSETWLSGGNAGLEGSLILTIVLVIADVMFLLVKRKESLNG